MAILETRSVSVDFGGLKALRELDVAIHKGEVFGFIGPNGAGKTTLVNVITGFLEPSTGSVIYKGESITRLKPYKIGERGIIRTFQITSIFTGISLEENITIGRHLKTKGNMWGAIIRSRNYRDQETKLRKKVLELLHFVGLENRRNVTAKNLSFGDQRKLEIAIALAVEPKLLLLDEPAAGMNLDETNNLISLIQSINKMGITVLIIEHNMKMVMELCTRVAVLDYGVKIAEGTPEEIVNNEKVISVYLGHPDEIA